MGPCRQIRDGKLLNLKTIPPQAQKKPQQMLSGDATRWARFGRAERASG
jgi:hypothetical protein